VPTTFSKNKKHKQIESVENGYVVKDDIELGFLNTIPLWAFGMITEDNLAKVKGQ